MVPTKRFLSELARHSRATSLLFVGFLLVLGCDTGEFVGPGDDAPTVIEVTGEPGGPVGVALQFLDRQGNPVAGRTVTWRVAAGTGTVTPSTTTTDEGGHTEATWSLGVEGGDQELSASTSDATEVTVKGRSGKAAVSDVTVTPESVKLGVGEEVQLAVTANREDGSLVPGGHIYWQSSNESVVTVNRNGKIGAITAGSALIVAMAGTLADTAQVQVEASADPGETSTASTLAAPTGLTVTSRTSSSVSLDWNDNTDGNLDHYQVYQKTTSGGARTLVGSPSSSAFMVSGLSATSTYYFDVAAVDDTGALSPYSDQIVAQTETAGTGAAPAFEEDFSSYTDSEHFRQDPHDYYLEEWNLQYMDIVEDGLQYTFIPDAGRDWTISRRFDFRKPNVLGGAVSEIWIEVVATFPERFHTTQVNNGFVYVEDVAGQFQQGEYVDFSSGGHDQIHRVMRTSDGTVDALHVSMSNNPPAGAVVTGRTSGAEATIVSDAEWDVGGASWKFLHVAVEGASGRFSLDQGVHGHQLHAYTPNDSKYTRVSDSLRFWDGRPHVYRQHIRLTSDSDTYRVWVDGELLFDWGPTGASGTFNTAADALWGLKLGANKNLPQKESQTMRFHRVRLWTSDPAW